MLGKFCLWYTSGVNLKFIKGSENLVIRITVYISQCFLNRCACISIFNLKKYHRDYAFDILFWRKLLNCVTSTIIIPMANYYIGFFCCCSLKNFLPKQNDKYKNPLTKSSKVLDKNFQHIECYHFLQYWKLS